MALSFNEIQNDIQFWVNKLPFFLDVNLKLYESIGSLWLLIFESLYYLGRSLRTSSSSPTIRRKYWCKFIETFFTSSSKQNIYVQLMGRSMNFLVNLISFCVAHLIDLWIFGSCGKHVIIYLHNIWEIILDMLVILYEYWWIYKKQWDELETF